MVTVFISLPNHPLIYPNSLFLNCPRPSVLLSDCPSVHLPLQINYYFINSQGHPIEGLAVMHYITHL